MAKHTALRAEVKRIETICKERVFQERFLGGNTFSIADAFFAPVVMHLVTYGLPVSLQAQQYI